MGARHGGESHAAIGLRLIVAAVHLDRIGRRIAHRRPSDAFIIRTQRRLREFQEFHRRALLDRLGCVIVDLRAGVPAPFRFHLDRMRAFDGRRIGSGCCLTIGAAVHTERSLIGDRRPSRSRSRYRDIGECHVLGRVFESRCVARDHGGAVALCADVDLVFALLRRERLLGGGLRGVAARADLHLVAERVSDGAPSDLTPADRERGGGELRDLDRGTHLFIRIGMIIVGIIDSAIAAKSAQVDRGLAFIRDGIAILFDKLVVFATYLDLYGRSVYAPTYSRADRLVQSDRDARRRVGQRDLLAVRELDGVIRICFDTHGVRPACRGICYRIGSLIDPATIIHLDAISLLIRYRRDRDIIRSLGQSRRLERGGNDDLFGI